MNTTTIAVIASIKTMAKALVTPEITTVLSVVYHRGIVQCIMHQNAFEVCQYTRKRGMV